MNRVYVWSKNLEEVRKPQKFDKVGIEVWETVWESKKVTEVRKKRLL